MTAPAVTLLHLSDVHASVDGALYGGIDGLARLRAASAYARSAGMSPDAILITGDLVERGHAAAYPAVQAALDALEEEWSVPVLVTLGNHDNAASANAVSPVDLSVPRRVDVAGVRVLLLDSSRAELGAGQLAWLRAELSEPVGAGTVIALHHPPFGSTLPALARGGLRDADPFLDAVAGSDVRAVLCGHFHHPMVATIGDVSVSVGPSLAYHQVMDAAPGTVAGHDRSMFSLVRVDAATVTHTSVTVEEPVRVFTSTLPTSVPDRERPTPLDHPNR